MTVSAMILPLQKLEELTLEQVVDTALNAGLLPCNRMQGPFSVSFFPRHRVPQGWSVIGIGDRALAAMAHGTANNEEEATCAI